MKVPYQHDEDHCSRPVLDDPCSHSRAVYINGSVLKDLTHTP